MARLEISCRLLARSSLLNFAVQALSLSRQDRCELAKPFGS
jgi:hypothetical protein